MAPKQIEQRTGFFPSFFIFGERFCPFGFCILQKDERRTKMDSKCSRCVHWIHGVCRMTGERRNDGVCNCGQFSPRKEN